tara:strand:- start:111554 stop:111946 length:393 start_codon:yes stop_codon:yes gene_type:complete
MNIATEVSTRSTCDRENVGSVKVKEKTILSTGYNESIRGLPHRDDVGHEIIDGHCVRTTHAEANVIAQTAKNGVKIDSAEIFITASLCYNCFKLIADAGIKTIYFKEFHRDDRIIEYSKEANINLIDMSD